MTHAETRARNAGMIAAHRLGVSLDALAAQYQMPRASVRKILGNDYVKPSRLPTARETRMAELYREGWTLERIGTEYSVTRERVRQVLTRRFGIDRMDGGKTIEMFARTAERQAKHAAESQRKEQRASHRWGMSLEQYMAHVAQFGGSGDQGSPMHRYSQQRSSAKRRNVAWGFTFAEWWQIWRQSGKWAERGPGNGYCMARHGDSGPYSVANVYICTIGENFSDSWLVNRRGRTVRGYYIERYMRKVGERFRVKFRDDGRYRCGFATKQDAEAFALTHLREGVIKTPRGINTPIASTNHAPRVASARQHVATV